jgi:hypothetical protein
MYQYNPTPIRQYMFGGKDDDDTFPVMIHGSKLNNGKQFKININTSLADFRTIIAKEVGLDVLPFILINNGDITTYHKWRENNLPEYDNIIGTIQRKDIDEQQPVSKLVDGITQGNTNLIYSLSVSK